MQNFPMYGIKKIKIKTFILTIFQSFLKKAIKNVQTYKRIMEIFWIWTLPKNNKRIAMFSSGMGDGIYSAYWGFDKNNEITELIVPFMNLEYF